VYRCCALPRAFDLAPLYGGTGIETSQLSKGISKNGFFFRQLIFYTRLLPRQFCVSLFSPLSFLFLIAVFV
jgi:hypothetical protein